MIAVDTNGPILYLGGALPTRSETFVYREVFALRNRGGDIITASVHQPEHGLGEARLDALADETIGVYGPGAGALCLDAMRQCARSPIRSLFVIARATCDAILGADVPFDKRPKLIGQAIAGLALARRISGLGVRHIHAHMAHVPTSIAMYTAMAAGLRFSFTGHAVDLFSQRTLLAPKLRRAAFVACISEWHRRFYQELAELRDSKLPLVRCGVDVPEPTQRATREVLRILGVGRLVPKKGFDVLLEALGQCGDLNFECTIVGDGPERDHLDRLVEKHNLGGRIHLVGAKSNREVMALMREADLFVLPCRIDPCGDRDGIPVVLMEAMAQSICVISGDLPTIRELVEDGSTGVMVEPDNVTELQQAIENLSRDAGLRSQLGAAGRSRVLDEFSIEVNSKRLLAAFERCHKSSEGTHHLGVHRILDPVSGFKGPKSNAPMWRNDMARRYVLISPCRDEAEHLQATIDSVAAQTVAPTKWIVIDDGSTDETPQILARAAERYPFITVIRREDRGGRSVGPGVMEAFYAGLETLDLGDYDYLCKLDTDLEFPARYFERLMEHFEADPWLGTLSGKLYLRYGDKLIEERCGDENSVGPAKFYRSACFEEIGGFVRQVSWDGIDGHMCRMNGWIAGSIREPELQIIHRRRMGSSQRSFWTGRLRWGRGKWFMGSSLPFIIAASIYRMAERPFLVSGCGILCGYLQGMTKRLPRMTDRQYLQFFRRFERRTLLIGRQRVLDELHKSIRRDFDRETADQLSRTAASTSTRLPVRADAA